MKELNNKEKKDFFGNFKASFSGRKFRSGAYLTLVSTVVIVIVLVANMLFSKMNIQFDLSSQGNFTLSGDTKDIVKGLKDDITIYYLVQPKNETDMIKNIVKKYDTSSDKITVVNKDPILYPNFASKYVDDKVTENSFLVVDKTNDKAKYVDYNDMLVQQMNSQTYEMETTGIDIEGKLTSAIQYVTSTDLPKMYLVSGHDEAEIGDTLNASLDKMNISTDTLKTASESSIPKDCDMLFINAPHTDFSEAETKLIKDYLTAGGKAIITLNYNTEELPNFLSILDYYGVEVVKGVVLEGDTNKHMANYPNALFPDLTSHDITALAYDNTTPVFMPVSVGLLISDTKRSSLTVEPLMTTSESAYSKVDTASSTIEKEDGDIDGPFNLGIVSTDTYNNVTSSIIVYSSANTFIEDTASYSNSDLLAGSVGFLAGDSNLLSIPTKSLADAMVYPSQKQAMMLGATAVIIIPAVILLIGLLVTLKRRNK